MTLAALALCAIPFPCAAQSDWVTYGHDPGQTKYSPLAQIDTSNVGQLQQAWVYHMRPAAEGGKTRRLVSSPATPLVIDGIMYLATPYNSVIALKPETGELLWTYNLEQSRFLGRSATWWPGDKITPASLFFGTADGRLLSLNAKTGKPTVQFGEKGFLKLKTGMTDPPNIDGRYSMTSAASIYKNLI
ncbi:MAG: PQQ-binding-like beta-propeller repeat protein, partial [Acidobacteriaceae bacterium]